MNRNKKSMNAIFIACMFLIIVLLSGCGVFAPTLRLSVGDDYSFGKYEWVVLEVRDGKALLITKDIVALHEYNESLKNVTWENCSLRIWLNDEFVHNNFAKDEKKQICKVSPPIQKEALSNYTLSGGGGEFALTDGRSPYFRNEPSDYIFLLSLDDVKKYYGGYKNANWIIDDENNIARQAKLYNEYHTWVLRTPGESLDRIVYITADGSIICNGTYVDDRLLGIRPALWIKLKGAK